MENKKANSGRKKLPTTEKKILVPVWVKSKHKVPATKDANKLTDKYAKLQ